MHFKLCKKKGSHGCADLISDVFENRFTDQELIKRIKSLSKTEINSNNADDLLKKLKEIGKFAQKSPTIINFHELDKKNDSDEKDKKDLESSILKTFLKGNLF